VGKTSASTAASELPILEPAWRVGRAHLGRLGRHVAFVAVVAASVVWAWPPLSTVIGRTLKSAEYEHYSHILLVPFISAYLIYRNRSAVLDRMRFRPLPGISLISIGVITIWLAKAAPPGPDTEYHLALAILGLVALWAGGFAGCYGPGALGAAAFPFLFLLLMIPLPLPLLDRIIVFLQHASADASALLFAFIGMPLFREGTIFSLPGLTIHVAKECSGIRSSLALLISGLVIAHLLLRSAWTKTALVLVIIPLAITKNAVRIVVLSWLAIHVDPSFITGSDVHRNSGIPVFLVSLTILSACAWLLRRAEAREAP
jgi:exosortase